MAKDPSLARQDARRYIRLPGGHQEGWADAFANVVRDIYMAIANPDAAGGHRPALATFDDGYASACLVDAVLRSHRGGGLGPRSTRTDAGRRPSRHPVTDTPAAGALTGLASRPGSPLQSISRSRIWTSARWSASDSRRKGSGGSASRFCNCARSRTPAGVSTSTFTRRSSSDSTPDDQAPRLQPIDKPGDIRRVAGEGGRQPAHRYRLVRLQQMQHVKLDR